jgi:uncharacterized protein DUF4157/putative RNase toxin 16 of polymorphic toxin system
VMRMPASMTGLSSAPPQVNRKCSECEEEDKKLQKKDAGSGAPALAEAPPSVHEVLRAPGRPLDAATRAFFEPRFGHDFTDVRIHVDDEAAHSARSMGALAYAVGRHIVFGKDQFSTGTPAGRQTLAHELAHTIQQRAAPGLNDASIDASSTDIKLQRQGDPQAHSSGAPSVPYEKSSPSVEAMYRRNGLTEAANAVRRCRLEGVCSKVLTTNEAYQAYRTGRLTAGMDEDKSTRAPAVPFAAAGMLAPAASPGAAGGAVRTATALERAREAWQTAEVLEGGEVAAGEVAAPGVAGAATVAVPVALGVYLVVAVADLIGYGSFQAALQRMGYVILPDPLQVCISGCHQPAAPTREFDDPGSGFLHPDFPGGGLHPEFTETDYRAIEEYLQPSTPAPLPLPQQPPPELGPPTASRRRPARPAPTPAPQPAPAPATPRPRSRWCTEEEQTTLHDEVEKQCKNRGEFACRPGDSPQIINEKIAKLNACIDARERFQKKCWRKGDPGYEGHMKQIADLYKLLRDCDELAKKKTP